MMFNHNPMRLVYAASGAFCDVPALAVFHLEALGYSICQFN